VLSPDEGIVFLTLVMALLLASPLSRRDNILLTVDVNLRTGTSHTPSQVPQGRHYPERAGLHRPVRDEILVEKVISLHPLPSRMGRNIDKTNHIPSLTGRQQCGDGSFYQYFVPNGTNKANKENIN
jgi:hypothetical protein